MNTLTKSALTEYIAAVEQLAHSITSVHDSKALGGLYAAGDKLKSRLESDETIAETR